MSAPQEQIKDSQDSEVRFMYLTEERGDIGWKNWEGGETFIKEFNHVLTNRKKQNAEKPTDSKDMYTKQQLEKFRDIFFANRKDALQLWFGEETVIVTEKDDNPVGILLKDTFYFYFGVMRNLLHMSCWLSFPDKGEDIIHDEKEEQLLCCFLFKSRSQKLSEYTFVTDDDVKFDLSNSPEYE
jgi:hypothetical protein